MASTTHPGKEQLQQYLRERHASRQPPPSSEQIRRELGWELVRGEREVRKTK